MGAWEWAVLRLWSLAAERPPKAWGHEPDWRIQWPAVRLLLRGEDFADLDPAEAVAGLRAIERELNGSGGGSGSEQVAARSLLAEGVSDGG